MPGVSVVGEPIGDVHGLIVLGLADPLRILSSVSIFDIIGLIWSHTSLSCKQNIIAFKCFLHAIFTILKAYHSNDKAYQINNTISFERNGKAYQI